MRKKISDYWLKKIILHFCVDIEASKTATLIGLNRNTVNSYYNHFRRLIALQQEALLEASLINETKKDKEITAHQTARLSKGKIEFKKLEQNPVYGLFEKEGQVFADVIHPVVITQLIAAVRDIRSSETFMSRGFRHNYDALLYGMFPKLVFLNYSEKGILSSTGNPLVIESFWSFCCRRLYKFNGISRHFYLHLKECEWRWKRSENELIDLLAKMVL